MNMDQLTGLLRIIVPAVCAWLASKGADWFGLPEVQTQIVTIVVGLAALVWSYFSHSDAAKLKAASLIDPAIRIHVPSVVVDDNSDVRKVVNDPRFSNVEEA